MNEETPSIQFAPASVTIQPGEQTTEHAMAEIHNFHASLIKACGSATGLLTSLADMLGCCPDNKYVLRALAIIGFALAGLAHLSHMLVTMNYLDGRSLIKAQAANAQRPGPSIGALILFALLLSLPLSSAHAEFEVVKAATPNAVNIHDNGTVSVPKDAVHGEAGMVKAEATAQSDSFKFYSQIGSPWQPLVYSPMTITANPSTPLVNFVAPPHMVYAHGDPGMVQVHDNKMDVRLMDEPAAKALGGALVAAATLLANTLHETNTNFSETSHKAEQDARYFAYAMGALLVAALVGWFFHVRWHKSKNKEALQ